MLPCIPILLLLVGCSSAPRLVVGSKNFTEQVVLGELLAQHLESRLPGIRIERTLNLGGTLLAHEALKKGDIDLYPEYTGTALTAVLKRPTGGAPHEVLAGVRDGYRQWGLAWLDPLGFDNTFAMVVRSEVAEASGIQTLSEAARLPKRWVLGAGYEFAGRPDGLAGLLQTYKLQLEGSPVTMDLGLLYQALKGQRVELAAANATDGRLADSAFRVLADDRRYFPPYQCAVVVRESTLSAHPALRAALQQISGRIDEGEMRRMNAAVDIEHRPVEDVAREFLQRSGLR